MPTKKDIDRLRDKLYSLAGDPAAMEVGLEASQDAMPEEEDKSQTNDMSALLDGLSDDIADHGKASDDTLGSDTGTDLPDPDDLSLPQDADAEAASDDSENADADDFELPSLDPDNLPGAESVGTENADADDFELPSLDPDNLPGAESVGTEDADAEGFDLSSLDPDNLPDAKSVSVDSSDDFELPPDLGAEELFADTAGTDTGEDDFELPPLDDEDSSAEGLENIFGDSSVELEDNPDALLDRFSEQGDSPDSSDGFDLSTLDDIFEDKEQDGKEDAPLDSEDPLASDAGAADFDLNTLDSADGDDFELPSLDSEAAAEAGDAGAFDLSSLDSDEAAAGAGEDDFELPSLDSEDPLASDAAAGAADFDLNTLDSADGDDFELPSLDSDDAAGAGAGAGEDDFELPSLDSGEDKDFELPSLDSEDSSADKDFDIGSLDSLSMDDEFEKKDDSDPDSDKTEPDQDKLDSDDDFNLDDLGDKFSSVDDLDDAPLDDLLSSAPAVGAKKQKEAAAKPKKQKEASTKTAKPKEERSEKLYISAEKLKEVVDTLSQYPGNLKFYIEDLIGNKDISRANLDSLVDKLAAGVSAREMTDFILRLTGKRIRIPAHYQRKTWQELEREKRTFSYMLRYKIAPFLGKALAASFALLFLLFLINTFIVKPIHSSLLYNRGYESLENGNFVESERNFLRATRIRPVKKQFYRYADAYIERREFAHAELKYVQLLGISLSSEREKPPAERQRGFFPGDKRGFMDYSVLKTFYMGDFRSAERIIEDFINLDGNKWDYEMLLMKIDNYLNWAVIEHSKYDDAEYVINDSLSKFGQRVPIYLRKIAHSIRSGELLSMREEAFSDIGDVSPGGMPSARIKYYITLNQYRTFLEGLKGRRIDAYIAADFYDFHLTHENNVDGLDRALTNTINADKMLLEPHFHLARFWDIAIRPELERRSLQMVERLAEVTSIDHIRDNYPHSYMYAIRQRKYFEIMALNRLGIFEHEDENILLAQGYFQRSIREYENNIDILDIDPKYGKIYEDYGNLYYYSARKYNDALTQFLKAEATGLLENNLSYKIGFVYYKNTNYKEASERFYEISLSERANPSALYAFANSAFLNSVYSPAMAYYEQVLEILELWRDRQVVIEFERRRDQRLIMQRLMETYNNLGATLYRMSERTQNQAYYSRSLVNLTISTELYDLMARDPETVVRSFTRPLAQLNVNFALFNAGRPVEQDRNNVIPYSARNLQMDGTLIYTEIDKDLFGRVELME